MLFLSVLHSKGNNPDPKKNITETECFAKCKVHFVFRILAVDYAIKIVNKTFRFSEDVD